ncbi:MAG: hypothetical protein V8S71_00130 [Oscillospiraceae bacterium]
MAEFYEHACRPQIQDAMKGLPKMHEFEPDVIIAVAAVHNGYRKDHVDHV